ncbi:MAG: S-layer homology domain-containing protein [Clostridiales bacterium]|nr:S-layer homology domain-containing protein [Clostridiales bacterium]
MRESIKNRFILVLIITVITGNMLFCTSGFAVGESGISSLSASYSSGKVTVNGTTLEDVLAVAVLLYDTDGSTLLRMETFGVNEGSFSAQISISLPSGTYTVKAADYNGGLYATTSFTYTSSSGGGTPGTPTPTPPPTYTANLTEAGDQGAGTIIPVTVDTKTATGTADLEEKNAVELFTGSGVISMPSIPGVSSYQVEMPSDVLSNTQGTGMLTLSSDVGDIVIPDNMLSANPEAEGKKASITIGQADKAELTQEEKAAVGERPLIQLALALDGEVAEWNNPNAPVTVSIPYTPSLEELNNPENIIIWYLDGRGELICIPNGRYNPDLGTVTFSTTHFSLYAIGYNTVVFSDVSPDAWYAKAVDFISARKITSGTGGGKYSPTYKLTRGEFIVMLMRAYGIAPDANPTDNFSDAGNNNFTNYLAAAKRLGISNGIGNNLFGTDNYVTRQEMFTMLYNALKVINMLPESKEAFAGKPLSSYSDADEIHSYAREAMKLLVETGTIVGSDGKLSPKETTTRAQMAQVLYNLLTR